MLPTQPIDLFDDLGVVAFTTTRAAGTFGLSGDAPVGEVMERWRRLRAHLSPGAHRLATARQVHGSLVVTHDRCWEGWLHHDGADGHVAPDRGLALAVTVADCVPVFLAHPSGAIALLHSGWRGTEARIVERGISALAALGHQPAELRLALGPAICGACYEVSADVYGRLTGRAVERPTPVDLRALIADHARGVGVRTISVSPECTRCHNDRFFSHRAGDLERQIGVMLSPGEVRASLDSP